MLWRNVQTKDKLPQSGGVTHLQYSHGENLPHLSGLPGPADRATRLGEVPHLSCELNQEKNRIEIVWRDWLPHRGGVPPLPGVPHLHLNRL